MNSKTAADIAQRLLAAWNARDLEEFIALLADDVEWYDPAMPDPPARGRTAVKVFAEDVLNAFPDFKYEIQPPICAAEDGSRCAIVWRISATHLHPLRPLGYAPTGRKARIEGVDVLDIRDGKVARILTAFDLTPAAEQLLGLRLRPIPGTLRARIAVATQRLLAHLGRSPLNRLLGQKKDAKIENIMVEPMTEEFILWRCLHGGPLSRNTIDRWPSDSELPWERYRKRNLPLLVKLIRTYGACAVIARDGNRIIGQLRFYPKAVWKMAGAGELCLQQDHPAGPADDFAAIDFPIPSQIDDKTLLIHCLMTGSPQQKENPYQRKGIGARMVKTLIQWAKANGWEHIEANSFEDIPIIYEITGNAGHSFWEKLGFSMVDRYPHPYLKEQSPFLEALEDQAKLIGIPAERARDQIVMRLDLI